MGEGFIGVGGGGGGGALVNEGGGGWEGLGWEGGERRGWT